MSRRRPHPLPSSAPAATSAGGGSSPRRWLRRPLGFAALATLSAPVAAGAQSLDSLPPFTRIRVELPAHAGAGSGRITRLMRGESPTIVGALTGMSGDTLLLTVRDGVAPVRVPRNAIGTVQVSRGTPARWKAALRGAILPAIAGAAIRGAAAGIRDDEDGPSVGQAALTGAAIGAAFAATRAALFPRERWERLR